MKLAPNEVFYDTVETARKVKKSPKTLQNLRVSGGGPPYVKFGNRVVYPDSLLMEYMALRLRETTSGGVR
jgi:hypothetical protein